MSEPQERIDISDLRETFLECPVCTEHFNQTDKRPRLLHSCLHAFCTQCLHQLLLKEGKGQITCPLCRNVQKIRGKVDTLPIDPVRGKLVEYVQIRHSKKVPCDDCPDGNDADFRCQECSLYMCKECTYVHKRHRLTNDHSVMPLGEVLEQPLKTFSKGHFCSLHPKHHLEFYCITDESVCCLSCTVLEHHGHKFQKVEEAVKVKQQDLEASLRKVRAHALSLTGRHQKERDRKVIIQQDQVQAESDVTSQFAKLEKMTSDRNKVLLNDIRNRSITLMSSVQQNIACMEHNLAVIDSTEKYFNQAIENSDAVEMLQMYPSLKGSLEGSTFETTPADITQKSTHVTFVPTFVTTVERIMPETGHVLQSSEGITGYKDTMELVGFVNEVLAMAMESKDKKDLLAKINEYKQNEEETSTCSKCWTATDEPNVIKCRHTLCRRCYDNDFKFQQDCPVCYSDCTNTGNMPPGEMETEIMRRSLPGFKKIKTIQIHYLIKEGVQNADHPAPGELYAGVDIKAYLPDTSQGRKVLALLKVAWDRRLTFEIEKDRTYFALHDMHPLRFRIPHKTSYYKYSYSNECYPDDGYLERVENKLAEMRVTEKDIQSP